MRRFKNHFIRILDTMNTHEIDMTTGSLWKKILFFSIPLMFSNLLQVFFNIADVAVVGKFAGAIALGSVGSTTIFLTLTTGILLGMASGVNAVTALFVGSRDSENLNKTVHTAILLCLAVGILLFLCGLFFSRPILTLMNTKPELIDGATLYLTVYLCGSPALAIYNYGNAILSAVGDTKRPLLYLFIAGVINVILNLIFVLVFDMSVLGVALSSIISQYISAFLVLHFLLKSTQDYALHLRDIAFDWGIAGRILKISIPSATQYSLFAVANICIQTSVNQFDHVVVEGNAAAVNADTLIFDMMAAFYTACTSFVAQNFGAGRKDRIWHSFLITTLYSFSVGLILGLSLLILQKPFLSLFTSDPNVMKYASIRITILSLSYCVSAFMDNATAASRGLGKSVAPALFVIVGVVVLRIIWLFTIFAYFHTLHSLYLAYVTTWAVTAICENVFFIYHYRRLPDTVQI